MTGNLSKVKGVTFRYEDLTEEQKSELLQLALPDVKAANEAVEEAQKAAEVAEDAVNSIKNLSATAKEGAEVSVGQSVTDEGGIVLNFTIPKGEKGDKGEQGEQGVQGEEGYTPVKGIDYFTDEEKEELLSTPRTIYQFTNGTRLEAREDGVYAVTENENEIFEQAFVDMDGTIRSNSADYAYETDYAYYAGEAENDLNGRPLKGIIVDDYAGDVEDAEYYLSDGYEVYYGIVSNSLVAAFEEDAVAGFLCALHFATPEAIPTDYSWFPDTISFKGDSVVDGRFVPEENMRYTVVFSFDGYMVNGYVSGVSTI